MGDTEVVVCYYSLENLLIMRNRRINGRRGGKKRLQEEGVKKRTRGEREENERRRRTRDGERWWEMERRETIPYQIDWFLESIRTSGRLSQDQIHYSLLYSQNNFSYLVFLSTTLQIIIMKGISLIIINREKYCTSLKWAIQF